MEGGSSADNNAIATAEGIAIVIVIVTVTGIATATVTGVAVIGIVTGVGVIGIAMPPRAKLLPTRDVPPAPTPRQGSRASPATPAPSGALRRPSPRGPLPTMTPPEPAAVRMDKWLWAVRLYKTRSLAAAACTNGRVLIDESPVKPARSVRVGDTLSAVTGEVKRTVRVLKVVERRISASQVPEHFTDLTPAAEFEQARDRRRLSGFIPRPPGAGRPTKKERRALESLE